MTQVRTTLLLGALIAAFVALGMIVAGPRGAIMALVVAAAGNLFALWNADKLLLRMHGAREVDARSCPELAGLVRDLARRARLPMPKVYVIDSAHPNAFATGRDPAHAAVAVTTGLLGLLDRDEIAGVLAHELGHVRNRDTLVMTLVATIAGGIAMLGRLGTIARGRGHPALLLALLVAPFAALLVRMAISRRREYGADAAGARICGRPHALASALAKLGAQAAAVPNPVTVRNPAMAALYIVPGGRDGMFATHPATARRIATLLTMATPARPASALDPLRARR